MLITTFCLFNAFSCRAIWDFEFKKNFHQKNKRKIMSISTQILSSERIYQHPDLFKLNGNVIGLEAKVIESGVDKDGSYVIFDKTIFHPQEGGKQDDKGTLLEAGKELYKVTKLSAPNDHNENPFVIKHYYESTNEGIKSYDLANKISRLKINTHIVQFVNKDKMANIPEYNENALANKATSALNISLNNCYLFDISKCNENQIDKIKEFSKAKNCDYEKRFIWQIGFNGHPWEHQALLIVSKSNKIFSIKEVSDYCSLDLNQFDCTDPKGIEFGHVDAIGFGLY